ncbi:MAG: tetratricopeptide repeat protein [Sedimentisphaerales bacterium]|nr:tetratricopeptide repeat protein [Sedimentisphaerales bacterium]
MAPEEKNENKGKQEKKAPSKRKKKDRQKQEEKQEKEFFVSEEKPVEEISEHEIFAGNEDFYKLLSESMEVPEDTELLLGRKSKVKKSRSKTISWIQRILIAGIITVAAMMGYVIIKNRLGLFQGPAISNAGQTDTPVPKAETIVSQLPQEPPKAVEEVSMLSAEQPISLDVAKGFYLQKEYRKAYQVYEKLYQALPEKEELLKDYLHFEMALCSENNKEYEQAYNLLTLVSESRSPVIRIISNYRLSFIEIQKKRYLRARTRAYKALALLKSVDFKDDWEISFECDCYYMAAQCLTLYIMSLSNTGEDLPDALWSESSSFSDPMENMNETQLKTFLESGIDQLYKGLLAPKIKRLEEQSVFPRWSVTCFGSPLEEFVSKFATSAGFDIRWIFEVGSGSDSDGYIIRQRPVSLHLTSADSEQVMLIAAGCAELLAEKQNVIEEEKYLIYDPANYLSLNERVKLLSQHAISLWQKFMLTFHADQRLGNVHFAMGLLHTLADQKNEAIAEYKLVANRFSQISLAPYALLKSSGLKADIRDYQGARDDLKQLIEQYPDTQIYRDAYLRLSDVTKQAGLYMEAAQLFCRVYNFELSQESKIKSALGAGHCFYQAQVYEDAEIWFNRYISISGGKNKDELYSAYFLLGKTYFELKKYQQACDSFQFAITEQSSREQYIEAVKALVQSYIEKEDFIKALDALENTRSISLSQQQFVEMLIQKSTIYRNLGLLDTAIDLLKDRSDFVTERQLNAEISLELANCYLANNDLEMGRSYLSEVLRVAEPGEMAQKAAKKMAEVCLELGHSSQVISICRQLLDSNISGSLKSDVTKILAQALNQEKKFEEAALVLSVQE